MADPEYVIAVPLRRTRALLLLTSVTLPRLPEAHLPLRVRRVVPAHAICVEKSDAACSGEDGKDRARAQAVWGGHRARTGVPLRGETAGVEESVRRL